MNATITITPPRAQAARWRQMLEAAVSGWQRPLPSPEQAVLRDVAEVRALADSYRNSDPGFASDLYAAADRHELALEVPPGLAMP
jgi:hypothetical protein